MASRKRKKIIRRQVLFVALIVFALAGAWMIYQLGQYGRTKFVRYPEFGIAIPETYTIPASTFPNIRT